MPTLVPVPLPPPLLDTILPMAPLDVLLFDTELFCRYAAPAGDTLFGRTDGELIGQSSAEIFSGATDDLHSALKLAADTAASYQYPSYRYTFNESSTQTLFCWSVRVEPVAFHDYRGREEFRGVLVTMADVRDLADENERLSQDNDQLRRDNDRLQHALADAQQREASAIEARHRLHTNVRNLLAPVVGYLQVLSRRPAVLRGQPPGTVIEEVVLPGLRGVVETVDRYDAAHPPMTGPGTR